MSTSELQFIQGMTIICVISIIVKYVALVLFNHNLNDDEKNILENQLDGEIRPSMMILSVIYYIAHCSFFLNTAILLAIVIKERVL